MFGRVAATVLLVAIIAYASRAESAEARVRRHAGYQTFQSTYGYRPYRPRIGPIRARYELDDYVYSPRQAGVDYSYGIGYFFGQGPGDRAYQAARRGR